MRSIAFRKYLAVVLVVLLVFQLNALVLHEYNLRQQGFELLYQVSWWASSLPNSPTLETKSNDFYHVGFCKTHFLISNFLKYLGFSLALGVIFDSQAPIRVLKRKTVEIRSDYFLSSLLRRASPPKEVVRLFR